MTIAFLTPEFPHQSLKKSAGIGTSIENLSLGLIESGFKVVIFAIFQNHDEVYQNGNLTIVSIAKRRYKVFGWYLNRKHIEQRIRKEIKLRGIDIIEAPDWTGISAFMKFEIPLVVRLHGTDAYFCKLEGRKQKWKNFIFEKLALKNADALVSVSNYTANVTKKIF